MFENMRESRSLDGTMGGDSELEEFVTDTLLKTDVAASLTNDGPAIPLESLDDVKVGKAGNLGQSSISLT